MLNRGVLSPSVVAHLLASPQQRDPWRRRVAVMVAGLGERHLDDLVSRTVAVAQQIVSD